MDDQNVVLSKFDTIDKPRDNMPAPQKANFVRNTIMGDDDDIEFDRRSN